MTRWSEDEARFFGKITAGITHEMKNVLAIIRESSGLMEDLFTLCREVEIPHREKFDHALRSIKAQVARGVELSARLNRFAHSTDEKTTRVDLADLLEQVVVLSRRFARLQHVELQFSPPPRGDGHLLLTRPVRLQMLLFGAFQALLSLVPAGGELTFSLARAGEAFRVTLDGAGGLPDAGEGTRRIHALGIWEDLQALARDLEGSLVFDGARCAMVLTLSDVSAR